MNNLKLLPVAVCAAIVMIVVPGFVRANTITEPATVSVPMTKTEWAKTISFPEFNPSLGTLVSVTLNLSGSMSTVITVTNHANSRPGTSSGTATTVSQISVEDPGDNLASPGITLTSPGYPYSLAAEQSVTSGPLSDNGSDSNTYTQPGVLSEFTGAGIISLSASTSTSVSLVNTGAPTTATANTYDALNGSVTYTYVTTITPEPSTVALLCVAVMGLMGFGWRKRVRR